MRGVSDSGETVSCVTFSSRRPWNQTAQNSIISRIRPEVCHDRQRKLAWKHQMIHSTRRRLLVCCLFVLSPFLASGFAALGAEKPGETASIPMSRLKAVLGAFESVPDFERDRVLLNVKLTSEKATNQPIQLWIEMQGKRIEIAVNAAGIVTIPSDPQLLANDPVIHSNQPKGSLSLSLILGPKLSDPRSFLYSELRQSATQINNLLRRKAGFFSLFPPEVQGFGFRCVYKSACSITVHRRAGDETISADKDGNIGIKFERDYATENPRFTSSGPFAEITAQTS